VHRAHTSVVLRGFGLGPSVGYDVYDRNFRYLFSILYYEAIGARHPRPQRGWSPAPRRKNRPLAAPTDEHLAVLLSLLLGLSKLRRPWRLSAAGRPQEHQHQELLIMDLPSTCSAAPRSIPLRRSSPPADVEAAPLRCDQSGRDLRDRSRRLRVRFDHEARSGATILLQPFEIAQRRAGTNADWAGFIADGVPAPRLWLLPTVGPDQREVLHPRRRKTGSHLRRRRNLHLRSSNRFMAGEAVLPVSFTRRTRTRVGPMLSAPTEQEW